MRPELQSEHLRFRAFTALETRLAQNAETGYKAHPDWPAPEVLERPGWRFAGVTEAPEFHFDVSRGPGIASVAGSYDPCEAVAVEEAVIRPFEGLQFMFPGGRFYIGIHVGERVWCLFWVPDGGSC